MTTHTPGPWRVGGSLISAGNAHVARTLYRFDDGCPPDHDSCAPASSEESDANRYLIAAAPELLELCVCAAELAEDAANFLTGEHILPSDKGNAVAELLALLAERLRTEIDNATRKS